jgi:hypothetical protein
MRNRLAVYRGLPFGENGAGSATIFPGRVDGGALRDVARGSWLLMTYNNIRREEAFFRFVKFILSLKDK